MCLDERKEEKSRARTRINGPRGPGLGAGTGYARGHFGPTYGPHRAVRPQPKQPQSRQNQQPQRDEQLQHWFRALALILKGASSYTAMLNLMKMSLLGQVMEELLRNDSISDCSERAALYATFLTALEAIALNPQLVGFYISPRDEIECTDGLEKIFLGFGQLVKKTDCASSSRRPGSGIDEGIAPSLLEVMENLCKQAKAFYKTVGKVSVTSADPTIVNSINLCKSILGVRMLLESTAQRSGPLNAVPISQQVDESDVYRIACANLAYDEFPPSVTVPYHFTKLSESLMTVNPRRTITLAKELSTMATCLPPGIFVRNIPNRPDCIKALVAGAEGTPYYGGLFEFDIFAPENYPAAPPKVQLVTTANGKVRFNPNLYAYHPTFQGHNDRDGKVCLSLIGTWHGSPEEQWQPYKSTIMQILISIQSMLLCARPYFNEPGMGVPSDSASSLGYNQNARLQVIRVAICDWMTTNNAKSPWKASSLNIIN